MGSAHCPLGRLLFPRALLPHGQVSESLGAPPQPPRIVGGVGGTGAALQPACPGVQFLGGVRVHPRKATEPWPENHDPAPEEFRHRMLLLLPNVKLTGRLTRARQ